MYEFDFKGSKPNSVLHFDGKMITDFFGHKKEHRLAVLVSESQNEQLLGVPEVESECGIDLAEAIYNLLDEWGLLEDIEAFCADTTSTNTGKYKGAIRRLEYMLGRELLYLACRHHMYELGLRAAFKAKFVQSTGVDVPLFAKFKKEWKTIDLTKIQPGIQSKRVKAAFKDSKDELIQFFSEQLKTNFDRADHKELLELALIFLGQNTKAHFRAPGAMHHARWLSKAIYCFKMYIFRDQTQMSKKEKRDLESLCVFIVKFYVKAWMTCHSAIQAPKNDLSFMKAVSEFKKFDREISDAVIKKMLGHLWYLADECIAMALFDENVSLKCKKEMAMKIYEPFDDNIDKRKRVEVKSNEIKWFMQSELADYVTEHTIEFFYRFKIPTDFLKLEPKLWKNNPEYLRAFDALKDMKVVNDCAERGVKLISDFHKSLTSNEEERQFLLQVVSENRKLFPTHTKQTLSTTTKAK